MSTHPEHNQTKEISFVGIVLAIVLAIILAASNTFLALKIGFVTAASIPASIFAMGFLRFFKRNSILENNLVQTGASAGEAVAVGMVFTIPALIIIHYWTHFNYWSNFAIAVAGGILGILFTIPLRKTLVTSKELAFPEAKAIAQVLQANSKKPLALREILSAGLVGSLLEIAQSGLKIIASSAQAFFSVGKMLFGLSAGFSATLIGAGYLIGFNVGVSLFLGALITWLICVPLMSGSTGVMLHGAIALQNAVSLYSTKVRYLGIGAMLMAGVITLLMLFKPIYHSIHYNLRNFSTQKKMLTDAERDLPFNIMFISLGMILIFLYFLFFHLFNFSALSGFSHFSHIFVLVSLICVLILGFVFAMISAYFSGLIGVSVSPISSVIIMSVLLIGLSLKGLASLFYFHFNAGQLLPLEAMAIIIGSVIIGAASITNDNIQDLKVGYLLGSTPWKQQIMLFVGVIAAAAVIPPILNLLFNAYGIAGVMPQVGMNPNSSFAAPPAAMMATITQAIFNQTLAWPLFAAGAGIIMFIALCNYFLLRRSISISLLGVALGIYLPLSYSTPLFMGALIAHLVKKGQGKNSEYGEERGTLIACGLVAGAAITDIFMAIPMGMAHSPDILNIMPASLSYIATMLGLMSVIGLGCWFYRAAQR